jgi:hypothetical protein
MCADGEVVWSWRPKLASSLAETFHANRRETSQQTGKATGAMELVSPRRARRKPLKPSAQGRPGCPGFTCGPPVRVLSHTGLRVPAGARPSLRPFFERG